MHTCDRHTSFVEGESIETAPPSSVSARCAAAKGAQLPGRTFVEQKETRSSIDQSERSYCLAVYKRNVSVSGWGVGMAMAK